MSRNNRILPFSTRSRSPVVTGRASLKPLLVSRGRSRKAISRLFMSFIILELVSVLLIRITMWFGGRRSETDAPHSMTMMLSGFARFSARSSDMSPGSWRR